MKTATRDSTTDTVTTVKIGTLYHAGTKIKEAYYGTSSGFVKVYAKSGKVNVDGYSYTYNSGDLELTSYTGSDTTIKVPELE